jgi:two-component system, NarL family, nitrate/nitrite response regulator NarL
LPDRPFFYCASGTWATPPELVSSFTAQVRQHAQGQAPHLSERERQILQLIADGKSVPDMATELFLAQTTIKTHIRRLYEKLGVSDRGAAVAQAMPNQLLELARASVAAFIHLDDTRFILRLVRMDAAGYRP